MSESTPRFSSRLTFLLSALGIAIGTGNIWRFPRIAASNGGENGAGSFLIAWLMFLFLWSIPLIIVEYVMGRKARKGTIGPLSTLWENPLPGWAALLVSFPRQLYFIILS